jgi:hypothetical protein
MADAFNPSNFKPDQGRGFISSILSKLPYADIVQDANENNPKYELFHRLTKNRETKIMKQSVITGPYVNNENDFVANAFSSDKGYHQYIYAQMDTDKARRLSEYRRMAAFAEVSDCLDEICDEFINKDDNNNVISLKWNNFNKLEAEEKSEIEKEFFKFIKIYELEKNGWGYCRAWLTEGEVFWENVVHEEKKDLGIVGVLRIPGELINPVYDNIQNVVINNFIFQKPIDPQNNNSMQYPPTNRATVNPVNSLQQQLLTLEGKQITYVHSSIWNEDFTTRVPFLENCRRAYKQVSLLEDSIIIYRMVRAPERLKFKIDVGNMPPHKAEATIKQMMQAYRARKTYDGSSSKPGAANIYEPLSMLDDFWFAKKTGETGSDVEMMQGGANISEIADLLYFVKKLYRALKVPESRLSPETTFADGAQILREELRFAKFILRIQHHFAQGFKQAFITHLKLRNWWKDYKLNESFFDFEFTPPSSYFAIRQQQMFDLKYTNFNNLSQNESMSKTYCQRYYLGLSDDKISENMEWRRKDEALKWELSQIQQFGPNWREHMEAMAQAGQQLGAEGGGPVDLGGGGGGGSPLTDITGAEPPAPTQGSENIPEFGGPAAQPEAQPETPNQPSTV